MGACYRTMERSHIAEVNKDPQKEIIDGLPPSVAVGNVRTTNSTVFIMPEKYANSPMILKTTESGCGESSNDGKQPVSNIETKVFAKQMTGELTMTKCRMLENYGNICEHEECRQQAVFVGQGGGYEEIKVDNDE